MSLDLKDGKKMNSVQKREKGSVYGVNDKGLTEFHLIEKIPIKEFGGKTVGEMFKILSDSLESEKKSQEEKNEIFKKVLERVLEKLEKIEGVLDKYGMV